MKNLKKYEDFKRIIGGSKLALAGAGLGATLIMSGCSGCAVEPEPTSSITIETSELPSQIEIIETSEEPSEEIIEDEVKEMPELILRDENGKIYEPNEITVDQVYAAIDRLVEENDLDEYDRDTAIAAMLILNGPYISKDTFMTICNDYLANFEDSSMVVAWREYVNHYSKNEMVDYKYLIIDEQQYEVLSKISDYKESKSYSADKMYNEIFESYITYRKENDDYNTIMYLLCNQLVLYADDELADKIYQEFDDGEAELSPFYPTDGLDYKLKLRNNDGYQFVLNDLTDKQGYQSSHHDKALVINN